MADLLARGPDSPPIELVALRTQGDVSGDLPLASASGKALFTQEIEDALLAGAIDLAVHSLKDMATSLPPALSIAAVLARADPRDVLISARGGDLDALPAGARVGTSSLRRRALLRRWRTDLELVELRGNVPTRLRKLDEGRCDAVVLAAAGIERLGLGARISAFFPLERMLPAAGQGAIAVEVRSADAETFRRVAALDDAATHVATRAERALLGALDGGCQVPVGVFGAAREGRVELSAVVCALDGGRAVEGRREGPASAPEELGAALARELLDRGAAEILAAIRPPPEGVG